MKTVTTTKKSTVLKPKKAAKKEQKEDYSALFSHLSALMDAKRWSLNKAGDAIGLTGQGLGAAMNKQTLTVKHFLLLLNLLDLSPMVFFSELAELEGLQVNSFSLPTTLTAANAELLTVYRALHFTNKKLELLEKQQSEIIKVKK